MQWLELKGASQESASANTHAIPTTMLISRDVFGRLVVVAAHLQELC